MLAEPIYNSAEPIILIDPFAFFDEEAEAVRLKAEEERREELETKGMEAHDRDVDKHVTMGEAEIVPFEID